MHFEGRRGLLAPPARCGVLKSHTKMDIKTFTLNFLVSGQSYALDEQ